jgi:putative tryptophan/tyrosine transport system substrate-binding protein
MSVKEEESMTGTIKTIHWILIAFLLLGMTLTACGNKKSKTYTVGVINIVPDLDKTLMGFKAGMTELGYREGENIRYIYHGPTTNMKRLSEEAQILMAEKVDMLLSITTPATRAAKEAAANTGTPVVFVVVTDPVGAGIVESMRQPGGIVTGTAFGIQEPRRLAWLVRIAPGIRKIYVPYNPGDRSPVLALKTVRRAALKLGVKLITREVTDPETLNDAIMNIPPEADAVFLLPDSLVSTRLPDLVKVANKLKLPTSGANVTVVKKYSVLTSYGFDQHQYGKQGARLADQIFKGVRPADLPVETAEFYLAINLKIAGAIGLVIPDEILRQAKIIIR